MTAIIETPNIEQKFRDLAKALAAADPLVTVVYRQKDDSAEAQPDAATFIKVADHAQRGPRREVSAPGTQAARDPGVPAQRA